MTCNLVFTVDSEVDIDAITLWYLNISSQLSLRFLNDLESTLNKTTHQPLTSSKVSKSIYKRKLKIFPYNVYFKISKDSIVVIGVIHFKRHSRVLRKRLK